MLNKHATGRAIRGGRRFTHRGVNYRQIGSGWMSWIVRDSDGASIATVQSYETPREAVDRAATEVRPRSWRDIPPSPPEESRRQYGRIVSYATLARRRYLRSRGR